MTLGIVATVHNLGVVCISYMIINDYAGIGLSNIPSWKPEERTPF